MHLFRLDVDQKDKVAGHLGVAPGRLGASGERLHPLAVFIDAGLVFGKLDLRGQNDFAPRVVPDQATGAGNCSTGGDFHLGPANCTTVHQVSGQDNKCTTVSPISA